MLAVDDIVEEDADIIKLDVLVERHLNTVAVVVERAYLRVGEQRTRRNRVFRSTLRAYASVRATDQQQARRRYVQNPLHYAFTKPATKHLR